MSPRSSTCWMATGTMIRPAVATNPSSSVTGSPRFSTGDSSMPRLIVCKAVR
jgi:hypothetical protein